MKLNLFLWLGFALALLSPAPAKERTLSGVPLSQWIQQYHASPDPSLIPEAIESMRADGFFAQAGTGIPAIGFLSAIFERHPDRTADFLRNWTSFTTGEKVALFRALWYSGTPEGAEFINHTWTDEMSRLSGADLRAAKKHGSPDVIQISHPSHVDFLWGRFFGSGRAEPVHTIARAIPLKHDRTVKSNGEIDPTRMLIGLAAEWSLVSNAAQYPRVMSICEDLLESADPVLADVSRAVIADAEKKRKGAN